ncbi:hypothetical protein KFZ76_02035 [Methylovulum psychrotolerans]|jgi:hypothetical protein|uniref:hypothetical protein n=1 Tax=Methylovulum psychrotolerans TaxID=1704499 RepID=UPI001BFF001D|nr:hypothetical protein [Methylovulum psychrotolerans]MBT9096488.1 hypothetical protein [Methylovulum psychrotolerans]
MDTDKKRRSNWIWIIPIIAIIAFGIVIGLYWEHFGGIKEIKTHPTSTSDTNTDNAIWGVLGDYVGGTLNPLLSFFALCALLWTIQLQIEELETSRREFKEMAKAAQEQVSHFKSESQRTDLYRIIEKLAGRIETNFDIDIVSEGYTTREEDGSPGEYVTLNYSIRACINGGFGLRDTLKNGDKNEEGTRQVIQLIEVDLKRLANYIKKYQATNPLVKTPIHDFYREEFGDLVRELYKLELIKDVEIYSFYADFSEIKLGTENYSGLPPK